MTAIVPAQAQRLIEARPRVEISDRGEEYRVRVARGGATLERTYSDPQRNCGRRARFAAEFVVVALLPPELPGEEPPASAPPPKPTKTASPVAAASVFGVEISATASGAPSVFGAPSVLSLGGEVRLRLGAGAWAAIVGVGYVPGAGFSINDVQGRVSRIPLVVGLRARTSIDVFRLGGELGAVAAVERYEGVSPNVPRDATRLAPGLEGGVIVSAFALAGLAPFVSLRAAVFPVANDLGTTPQGLVGRTPLIWVGGGLGLVLAL